MNTLAPCLVDEPHGKLVPGELLGPVRPDPAEDLPGDQQLDPQPAEQLTRPGSCGEDQMTGMELLVPSAYGDPNQSQQTRSFNIAAEYLYTWQPVAASFSIRHDQNSLFEDATTFGIGGSVLLRSTKWFARIASGFKNPTFTERFGYTPDTFVGNPDLTPESSKEFQIGVHRSWRGTDLSLVYFNANLKMLFIA